MDNILSYYPAVKIYETAWKAMLIIPRSVLKCCLAMLTGIGSKLLKLWLRMVEGVTRRIMMMKKMLLRIIVVQTWDRGDVIRKLR